MYTQNLANSVKLELVEILPGRFLMGSLNREKTSFDDEEPQHLVEITEPYYLGKYLVTQAQWKAVMGNNPSKFTKGDNYPVDSISWQDCQEFLKKLNNLSGKSYRLPSETEWEYACRAGTQTPFHFGETISTTIANYDGEYIYGKGEEGVYRGTTTPVGSFPPNGFGLYDMHGNLYEWCEDDWYHNYKIPRTQKPHKCTDDSKVLRGGSWCDHPERCRSAFRRPLNRALKFSSQGFRIAHSIG